MRFALTAVLLVGLFETTRADTHYVAQGGQTPSGTYTSWAEAASNIQDAISVATSGDIVSVSNGLYETGGVTNWPAGTALTNRVAITNAITVRSANNDPTNTIIKGAWDPVTTNGPAAVRGVYMMNSSSAKLIGFMVTNGATFGDYPVTNENHNGGGVYCQSSSPVISNCVIAGNAAYRYGGGVYSGTLYNCTMISNSASQGGGAYRSSMYSCALNRNRATGGRGGAAYGTSSFILTNCTFIGNTASDNAGGAYGYLAIYNCTFTDNSANNYGAVYWATVYNCTFISNRAANSAGAFGGQPAYNCMFIGNLAASGGAASGDLGGAGGGMYNCLLIDNSAVLGGGWGGGGVYGGQDPTNGPVLYNCTVVNNSTSFRGGGVYNARLVNSIVYFNRATTAGSNWYSASSCLSTNSCTAPTTTVWEAGNTTANPMLADTNAANYRLAARSPCINAGTNYSWMSDGSVTSKDLDGRMRVRYGTADMGAYERIYNGTIYGFR